MSDSIEILPLSFCRPPLFAVLCFIHDNFSFLGLTLTFKALNICYRLQLYESFIEWPT
jgi:hypothetical protein